LQNYLSRGHGITVPGGDRGPGQGRGDRPGPQHPPPTCLGGFPLSWHITIADNGSRDRTWDIARRLTAELSGVSAIRLEQPGRGRALRSIWSQSDSEVLAYMTEFKRVVAEHKIHYFVGADSDSFGGGSGGAASITRWVAAQFRSQTVGGDTVYNLTDPR